MRGIEKLTPAVWNLKPKLSLAFYGDLHARTGTCSRLLRAGVPRLFALEDGAVLVESASHAEEGPIYRFRVWTWSPQDPYMSSPSEAVAAAGIAAGGPDVKLQSLPDAD